LVKRTHDVGLSDADTPFRVVDSCVLTQGGYTFFCVHRPEDASDEWDGWVVHDHHHNNDVETLPFLAYDDRQVNVSAEPVDYQPITLTTIAESIDAADVGTRIRDRNELESVV